MGVGKTSFAKHGVAAVLKRPFEFFSLGGAADSSNFVGHSYTYEGSTWGRIADSLMSARCMNPVMYFDELDKVSTTAHGEEIVSMLIHLTDRSQNTQFHDRYFAGVDFDLSQVLFVFSFNDESKVHPVLKDRMQVINCSGYSADEKKIILTQYVWPQVLDRIKVDVKITDDAVKFLINEYSKEEEGVRTLIRGYARDPHQPPAHCRRDHCEVLQVLHQDHPAVHHRYRASSAHPRRHRKQQG
jgi:ATP-dependent Lon protease